MPPLAAVIITKNEAPNIQDCLASVAWTAERIVVDAESSDRTADLARAAGATVIVRPWPGFGAQKNFGIDRVGETPPQLRDEVRLTRHREVGVCVQHQPQECGPRTIASDHEQRRGRIAHGASLCGPSTAAC